jgi:hypothetical protein
MVSYSDVRSLKGVAALARDFDELPGKTRAVALLPGCDDGDLGGWIAEQWLERDACREQRADGIRQQGKAQTFLHELQMTQHIVGSGYNVHPDFRFAINGLCGVVKRRRQGSLQHDARQVIEAVDRYAFATRQRVVSRKNDDQLLAQQFAAFKAFYIHWPPHEGHIQRS